MRIGNDAELNGAFATLDASGGLHRGPDSKRLITDQRRFMSGKENFGYVYILEVSDIDLPVCKIGQTSKNPYTRCDEINRSSTGDFLWQVAFHFPVNDCKRFERIVHEKLEPLRQKNREFFNVTADVAFDAVQSVLDKQPEIKMVDPKDIGEPPTTRTAKRIKKSRQNKYRKRDSEYAEALSLFTKVTKCKGRPFGQLNKPYFGISDGNEGVQWNIRINADTRETRLGVNLEGLEYTNWPIRNFLLAESNNLQIFDERDQLADTDQIFVRLARDAWQVTARPDILQGVIGIDNISIQHIDPNLWKSMLAEALACLSKEKGYRGRAKQEVTLKDSSSGGDRTKKMEVSPHLTIWTPIDLSGDVETQLKIGIDRLKPIYNWVLKTSQSG